MRFYLFSTLIFLASCSSKDTKMCDCLEAGEKLNILSAKLLTSDVTQKLKDEMIKLKTEKTVKCKDFQTMGGEEMLKLKAECQK